jgi:phosphoribosylformylglycinamidine synthase
MAKPNVLVMSGYGFNCEEETAFAFGLAGAKADIVHINDLIDGYKNLKAYQILVFPGGFSYGDDTGAGKAFANRTRNNLWEDLLNFLEKDTLVLGICNGFQILASLGLVPAFENNYKPKVALTHNDSARYYVRWADLEVQNDSPWLKGIKRLSAPMEVVLPKGRSIDEVADQNQNLLKEKGDWVIFPKTIEYIAKGLYAFDEKGNLYFDGQPILKGRRL